ncbi:amidase [Castellaniella sp. WN]
MTIDPFASLEELGRLLADGACTSQDLAELYLDRIARADGALHAFVDVDPESVRLQARASDLRRAAGHALGPLEGLPIAVKDLFDIEGRPGSCGSAVWKTRKGKTTSTVVRRLRAAGLVILGKTHMVELAFGGWGTNPGLGTPRNPWDLQVHRVPGGSSSGSGVAVAAGLAPAAIGSDTGGSVRIPASLAGITGLKTSRGLISRHGAVPLSDTLDTVGPMTRTVGDAALLAEILSGPDRDDPSTLGVPPADYRMAMQAPPDLSGLRIALLPEDRFPDFMREDVFRVLRRAAEVFRELGASVSERPFPFDFDDLMRRNGQIICAEAWSLYGKLAQDAAVPMGSAVRARVTAGAAIGAADYIEALAHHRRACAAWRAWMAETDALLTPTLPMAACRLDEIDENATPLSAFTRGGNYLGSSALSLPAGFSAEGLPIGVQLMAKPLDEASLVRLGGAFQRATDWHRRVPDLSPLL